MNLNKTEINVYFNNKYTDLDKTCFNLLWNGYSHEENNLSIISYIEKNDIFIHSNIFGCL